MRPAPWASSSSSNPLNVLLPPTGRPAARGHLLR